MLHYLGALWLTHLPTEGHTAAATNRAPVPGCGPGFMWARVLSSSRYRPRGAIAGFYGDNAPRFVRHHRLPSRVAGTFHSPTSREESLRGPPRAPAPGGVGAVGSGCSPGCRVASGRELCRRPRASGREREQSDQLEGFRRPQSRGSIPKPGLHVVVRGIRPSA